MWDQKTGRSRGYGFVAFRNEQVLELLEITIRRFFSLPEHHTFPTNIGSLLFAFFRS